MTMRPPSQLGKGLTVSKSAPPVIIVLNAPQGGHKVLELRLWGRLRTCNVTFSIEFKSEPIEPCMCGKWKPRSALLSCVAIAIATVASISVRAEEFDGYTEHYDSVEVATSETGIVQAVLVREGDIVQAGDIVAKLDDELHLVLLRIAEQAMQSQGSLNSAEAELQLRRQRLNKLVELRDQGHARQDEVERARADEAIAAARLLSAHEELLIKKLEHRKMQVQVERRTIRAPMDGVVTKIHKKKGGYVGPSDPYLLEMVRLNPLLAKFSLPSHRARQLRVGQTAFLLFEVTGQTVRGTIEFIGPVTDAQSATVQIKARIDNDDGAYYSGERCTIRLPSANDTQDDFPTRPASG